MFSGYTELTALDPREYLNWEQFEVWGDSLQVNIERGLAQIQYENGLQIGREYTQIHISSNGVWGATRGNCYLHSYEGIGYHACTKDLLHGFLDSGTPIVVYRYGSSEPTRIK